LVVRDRRNPSAEGTTPERADLSKPIARFGKRVGDGRVLQEERRLSVSVGEGSASEVTACSDVERDVVLIFKVSIVESFGAKAAEQRGGNDNRWEEMMVGMDVEGANVITSLSSLRDTVARGSRERRVDVVELIIIREQRHDVGEDRDERASNRAGDILVAAEKGTEPRSFRFDDRSSFEFSSENLYVKDGCIVHSDGKREVVGRDPAEFFVAVENVLHVKENFEECDGRGEPPRFDLVLNGRNVVGVDGGPAFGEGRFELMLRGSGRDGRLPRGGSLSSRGGSSEIVLIDNVLLLILGDLLFLGPKRASFVGDVGGIFLLVRQKSGNRASVLLSEDVGLFRLASRASGSDRGSVFEATSARIRHDAREVRV